MARKKLTDPNQADALGLGADVEIAKLVPAIQPADAGFPVVAKYLGYEVKHSRQFNRDQRLYMFQLPADFGSAKFSLWAQTQLDLKLASIVRQSIVLIQYLGRGEGDRAQHNWSVRPFKGTSAQLKDLIGQYSEGCAIVKQTVDMLETSINGQAATNDDDDDLPF